MKTDTRGAVSLLASLLIVAATTSALSATRSEAAQASVSPAIQFSIPHRVLGGGALTAVSCPTTTLCVASGHAGSVEKGGRPMVAASSRPELGTASWSSAVAFGSDGDAVHDLACLGSSFCVAVGQTPGSDGKPRQLFMYTGNPLGGGATWTHESGDYGVLDAVDCATTSLCVASGLGDAGQYMLGTNDPRGGPAAWRLTESHQTSGLTDKPSKSGVDCPTANLCVTASQTGVIRTTTTPLAGPWREEKLSRGLAAISCAGEAFCAAFGSYNSVATSPAPRTAGTWSALTPLSNGAGAASCPTAQFCIVTNSQGLVGSSRAPATKAWAWQNPYDYDECARLRCPPRGPVHPALTDVACPTTRLCAAVDDNGSVLTATPEPTSTVPRLSVDKLLRGVNVRVLEVRPRTSVKVRLSYGLTVARGAAVAAPDGKATVALRVSRGNLKFLAKHRVLTMTVQARRVDGTPRLAHSKVPVAR